MEFIRKIIFLLTVFTIPLIFLACNTVKKVSVSLLEIKPLPREVVIEKKTEYDPVYSVMKIVEVSEENGIQKYLYAKLEKDSPEVVSGKLGEISSNTSFEEILGTFKIVSKSRGFVRGNIESLTHKIPSNSYVRVQIGQKAKEEE